jgi:DNA-binding NarL/FixJ family response regulator
MTSDLPFGRLIQAWSGSCMAAGHIPPVLVAAGMAAPIEPTPVLWLHTPDAMAASAALRPAALTSTTPGSGGFSIRFAMPLKDQDQGPLLSQERPRLMVADVDWCHSVGSSGVRQLHRHAPQVDWLLCWDQPSPRWIDALIQSGARGAVTRYASASELARAFDAVMTGEIWLPRRVLQWLYAFLLEAPRRGERDPGADDVPGHGLTSREAEAVALLRQGLTNQAIAERLGVSINTVKKHLVSAYAKCGIRSRRQTLR